MSQLLVATGPESSGKTTLAVELAATLGAPLVREAAREYLNELYACSPSADYKPADLLNIAQAQLELEQEALKNNPPLVVCDTDLLVIMVWSEVRYGRIDAALLTLFNQSLAACPRTYLLCDHQIPWEADPLREHPHGRDMLAQKYRQKLNELALPFLTVCGSPAQRLQQVLSSSFVAGVTSH